MGNHAILSASGSHRWLHCQPSARLELEFENNSSEAAKEGTAAHELCEHKLKRALRRRSKRPISDYASDEMEECTDDRLHIVDFKYGQGILVEAQNNPQMKLYALGALQLFDSLYDIKEVSMTIFQPRRANVSTWTIPVEELKTWAEEELKPKEIVTDVKNEFNEIMED